MRHTCSRDMAVFDLENAETERLVMMLNALSHYLCSHHFGGTGLNFDGLGVGWGCRPESGGQILAGSRGEWLGRGDQTLAAPAPLRSGSSAPAICRIVTSTFPLFNYLSN